MIFLRGRGEAHKRRSSGRAPPAAGTKGRAAPRCGKGDGRGGDGLVKRASGCVGQEPLSEPGRPL